MKISTNWLKDYVNIDCDLKDLALKITKSGVNIEGIESNYIPNLKIGKILSVVDHPDSDHMHVCMVDVKDSVKQIVCGAKNVRENLKVIVALDGTILPGNNVIKKSVIRGVESNGMICALFELGLEEKNEVNYNKGIAELDDDAPVGEDAIKYLGISDTIYTLDLNPNRNDCLSHIGFAYQAATVLNKKVVLPNTKTNEIKESINDYMKIESKTDNCFMYTARMVKNIKVGESPNFIKQRLNAVGIRSINNVVDISNYIMLEYGQPLHFFDQDKLGNNIVIRDSDNEIITTLDGKERKLTKEDIVITDGIKPVCIAGVMGGENTEVDNNTKTVLIESAIFNPYNTRYTSINLNLRSEASLRNEKKLNPDYVIEALNRACYLLEKYASGEVLKDTIVINNMDNNVKKASVTLNEVNNMIGINLTKEDVIDSLNRLDFKYEIKNDEFIVEIPNRRMDVDPNKADIIEEIGSIYGYDKIIPVLPIGPTKSGKYIGQVSLRKSISKRLRSLGLNEVRTYTLIGDEENKLFKYDRKAEIELLKPMSNDKRIIRQTLIPSLLKVNDFNKTHNVDDILIYEIANTYFNEDNEDTKLAILLKGNYINSEWNKVSVKADFYLLKGILENLLDYLGFKNRYSLIAKEIDSLHPGVSASILLDREEIGIIGKVHPSLTKEDIYVLELSINKLNVNVKPIKHKEISKYPSIVKDVSFIVNDDIISDDIVSVIKKSGGRLLTDIKVFDVYNSDSKSIAYSLTFSDSTRTLTDSEVNTLFEKIMNDVINKLNCKVKSI